MKVIQPVGGVIQVKIIALLLGLLLWPIPSHAAEEGVRVTGLDGTPRSWTAAHIKEALASDMKAVEITTRGQKHVYNSVPLLAVLRAAGVSAALKMDPKADPRTKNYNLRLAVVVQGGDGYIATFSLAELLPEIGNREAWLALDEDGKPLAERDGTMKLIVPGDLKPARWVRNVAAIAVVDPAGPTTRASTK